MCEVYYFGQTDNVQALSLLDRHAYQQTLTLEEFLRRQSTQMDRTLTKLKEFLDHVAILASQACQVDFHHLIFFFNIFLFLFLKKAVELEGIELDALENPNLYRRTQEEEEEEKKAQSFLESKQNRTSMLRDLNLKMKPKKTIGPSFTVRKHWRDTLTRLTEFLRLLDYLILELLRRLVKSSVRDFLIHLRASFFVDFELNSRERVDDEEEKQYQPSRLKSPMSSLKMIRTKHSNRADSRVTFQTVRTNVNSELSVDFHR